MKRTVRFLLFGLVILMGFGFTGCGDDDHVNIFHATFVANDQPKDYTTTIGFLNISGYAISYDQDRDHPVGSNHLQIDLPANVKAGDVFTHSSHGVLLLYQDAAGTWHDSRENGSTLQMVITAWGGMGGYGHGTFEATLIDDFGTPVILTQGAFEGFIHN